MTIRFRGNCINKSAVRGKESSSTEVKNLESSPPAPSTTADVVTTCSETSQIESADKADALKQTGSTEGKAEGTAASPEAESVPIDTPKTADIPSEETKPSTDEEKESEEPTTAVAEEEAATAAYSFCGYSLSLR
jgi:hypothetical protein